MTRQLLHLCVLAILLGAAQCDSRRSLKQENGPDFRPLDNVDLGVVSVINEDSFGTNLDDVDACAVKCDEAEGCLAFTFHKADFGGFFSEGDCFLFDVVPQGRPSDTADSGVIAPKVDDPEDCSPTDGVTFLGAVLQDGNLLTAENAEECCLRCQEAGEDCVAYTFLEQDGTCWLKAENNGEIPCEDCASGVIGGEVTNEAVEMSDDPEPPEGGEWDVVVTGILGQSIEDVWDKLKDPRYGMSAGFRHLAYSTTQRGSGPINVEVGSGEEFTFQVAETSDEGMFHVYKIADHTKGVLQVPPETVKFIGSYTFLRILPDETGGFARVNWGFQGEISPQSLESTANFFFSRFMEVMIANLKLEFGSGDCLEDPTLREPQGTCNNPENTFGAAFTPLNRLPMNDPAYRDGEQEPSGSNISPRLISNAVSIEGTNEDDATNRLGLTDMHVYFGQFLDHDIDLTPKGALIDGLVPFFSLGRDKFNEPFPIEIPEDDPEFTGDDAKDVISFPRGVWQRDDNEDVIPRQHLNQLSSFLDLGTVYGNDNVRAAALRSFEGGKMKVGEDGFLPVNGKDGIGINLENVPNAASDFYVAGDVRASEDVDLLVMHALFLKEHNLIADELDEAFGKGELSDEQLYRYAKDINIAEWQANVYNEYLPLILCDGELPASDWRYDPNIDAGVDSFFSTVSFRFGHSMVGNIVWKLKPGGDVPPEGPSERFLLRDTFEKPAGQIINESNWAEWLLGTVWHEARELDTKMVDEMRSFLFTPDSDKPSNDLVSLNIQRARDLGLPMYNDAREAHGLERVTSFDEITEDEDLAATLEEVYGGDVDAVDPFIGGLAETPSRECRLLGDLFHESLKENFRRIRDGDRLFYKGFPFSKELLDNYPRLVDIVNDRVTLNDIIVRNSDIRPADLGGRNRGNLMKLPS